MRLEIVVLLVSRRKVVIGPFRKINRIAVIGDQGLLFVYEDEEAVGDLVPRLLEHVPRLLRDQEELMVGFEIAVHVRLVSLLVGFRREKRDLVLELAEVEDDGEVLTSLNQV